MKEPKFIVDEFMEYDRPELESVLKVINKKPKPYVAKAMFLKSFFQEVVKAQIRLGQKKKEEMEKMKSPEEKKKQLAEKKKKLMAKLEKLKKEKQEFVSDISEEGMVEEIPVDEYEGEHEPLKKNETRADVQEEEIVDLPGIGPEPAPPEI